MVPHRGVFAALSDQAPEVLLEAMAAARSAGAISSYDLHYRPSLLAGSRWT